MVDHHAIEASRPGDHDIAALVREIERLRSVTDPMPQTAAGIGSVTLTDAEREAIEYAASSILGRDKPFGWPVPLEIQQRARLLRGLVARLSPPAT